MLHRKLGASLAGLALVLAAAACSPAGPTPPTAITADPGTPSPALGAPVAADAPSASAATAAAPPPPAAAPAGPLGVLDRVDPADFVAAVDNPYFPLRPGTVWTYIGVKNAKQATEIVTVLPDKTVIDGVPCVALQDDVTLNQVRVERTVSYYAQHRDGDVWFFGEDEHQVDRQGNVRGIEGSWRAGVDGAGPDLLMPAAPAKGNVFDERTAELHVTVLGADEKVDVPEGSHQAVLMEEADPTEPGLLAHKYYVRDIGMVRDVSVGGPLEELKLQSVRRP
jgi:hypothetical protein